MRLGRALKGDVGWSFSILGKATINSFGRRISGEIVSIDQVQFARLSSPRFGALEIGLTGIDGHGQWSIEQKSGAVVVPYAISPEGELLLAGGYKKCLLVDAGMDVTFTPFGDFSFDQENPETTAKRKVLEETGVYINNLVEIGGFTPNLPFWIKEPDRNWPVTVFACKVEWSALAEKDGQLYLPATEGAIAELDKLSKLIFIPAIDAIDNTCDGIAATAFAKTVTAFKKGLIK